MNSLIDIDLRGSWAIVQLKHAPVNALSSAVRSALYDALTSLQSNAAVRGVLLLGAGRCFSAGADISEFQQGNNMVAGRDPNEVSAFIEQMSKPVVAALHGHAFGGGLELALSCHARVALPGTLMGLPEVQLGVLPGGGGTQRLPRLVGLPAATEMMLTGRPIGSDKALALGLIDAIIEGDLADAGLRHLEQLTHSPARTRLARDQQIAAPDVGFWEQARIQASSKRAFAFAGERIVECLQAAVNLPFDEGLVLEREHFLACNASAAAAALQHGFFAQREATKVPHIPAGTQASEVTSVAVVGGGTMGRGIAMAFANAGYPVALIETELSRAQAAVQAIGSEYQRLASQGRLSAEQGQRRSAAVTAHADDAPLRQCDLVIEAVFENLDIKRELCERLGRLCKPGALIATNTSTLDVNVLAKASGRPADFLGLHFFSPANVMRLLEVVRGEETSAQALATALALARRLDKQAVVCGVTWGFIGNRMLEPYLRETEALLLEGATPMQVDQALEAFGMAMGPCRMMDLAGVDVAAKVLAELDKEGRLPADPTYRVVCRALDKLGRLGQKTGVGFYRYEGRKALPDTEAEQAILALAQAHGVPQRASITDEEIVERCLLPLINEGFKILEEGIAYRSSDVDVVWLAGYGFPSERGGPLFYAQQRGLPWVRERLTHYAQQRGDAYGFWRPTATLTLNPQTTGEKA